MSNSLLQLWICTTPVLATLLLAPMIACAQPGAWLPAPVAAIVRAAAPAQMAQSRSARADASVSIRRAQRFRPRLGANAIDLARTTCVVPRLSFALSQSAPRAP